MSCLSCKSSNQSEFPAELLIHFEGLKNLDKPGVWVFPRVLVCLNCGFLQSTVPALELASLAGGGTSDRARVLGRMVDDNRSLRIELFEKGDDGRPRGRDKPGSRDNGFHDRK
jgi:hypothetical protein